MAVEGGDAGCTLVVEAPETASSTPSATRSRSTACASPPSRSTAAASASTPFPRRSRRTSLGDLEPGAASTSSRRCAQASRSAATSSRGTSTGSAAVGSVEAEGEGLRVRRRGAPEILRYCVEKGSITVDGVSLTVAELARRRVRRRAGPAHARRDDARRARSGPSGEPRGRRAREVRRAARGAPIAPAEPGYDGRMSDPAETKTSPFASDRGGDRGDPRGPVRRRRRRRGPRERGRPDDRRAVRDARGGQLHGDARPRADLPVPDARALRRARPAPDDRPERGAVRHRVHGLDRGARGVSTGISAADRARTIQVAIDPTSTAHDLVQPGHVFPLRARPGGVLQRSGQTEAAVDLARLAGLTPAGVVCEIMNDDGTMARVPDLSSSASATG